MKILIVSDTHRSHEELAQALKLEKPDRLIHLGDGEGCEEEIARMAGCPLNIIAGNNDFFTMLEQEEEIMLGKYRVLLTHGHYYYVSTGLEAIKREALGRGCDIVMFGHIHRPLLEQDGQVLVLNPGSIAYPRQPGPRPSYLVMEVDPQGEAEFEIRYL